MAKRIKLDPAVARQIKEIKRFRRRTIMNLVKRAYLLHRKGLEGEMHSVICDEFTKLGGVYVKFLQGVLLKSTMMKNWQSPNRLNIFENLESEPLNIQDILRRELGSKTSELAGISPEPFAAGSFGQVYFGQHKDGTSVIIKVLRPLIRETLIFDLRMLGWFMKSFKGKIYKNVQMNIDQAVEDFKRATLRETDYVEEASFANELYQTYKDHPKFVVPKTYLDLCTPNIIVQEYIAGISVAQLIKFKEQGVDIHEYVKSNLGSDLNDQLMTIGEELIYGIFALPRIQGDPHPGNIKLLENNRVGTIDFGISAKSPKEKAAFYAMLYEYKNVLDGRINIPALFGHFLRFFVSDLYRSLKKVTSLLPGGEDNDLILRIGRLAQRNFEKEQSKSKSEVKNIIENGGILSMMNQVVNKGNRFGLIMKLEDTEMLRAAQSYMTLVETLGEKTTVLPKAFDSALARVAVDFPEVTFDTPDLPSVNRSMEIISRWLERIADKDPALFSVIVGKLGHAKKVVATPSEKTPKPTPIKDTAEVSEKDN